MDRLEAMSLLLEAVEAGSLSAAARNTGAPLATVSRKVAALERRLGARLLQRSTRRLTLTDAGQTFVAAARQILEDVDEAERAAAGEYSEPRGELVVTAPVVFGRLHLLPIVTAFLDAYPHISVRLTLADRLAHLVDDHVDAALRIGELADSSLVATRLGMIRQVICASPAYLKARGTPTAPRDLADHDGIIFEGLSAASAWSFQDGKREVTAQVHARLFVSSAEAAVDAAVAGAGVTRVLSYQIATPAKAGSLAVVLRPFEPKPWPVHFLHASRVLTPLKLRAFLDFATPRLRAGLSRIEAL